MILNSQLSTHKDRDTSNWRRRGWREEEEEEEKVHEMNLKKWTPTEVNILSDAFGDEKCHAEWSAQSAWQFVSVKILSWKK